MLPPFKPSPRQNLYFVVYCSFVVMRSAMALFARNHIKCRGSVPLLYPDSDVFRFPVSDDKVSWGKVFSEYDPPTYTSPSVSGKPWADPSIGVPEFKPRWHDLDGNISRVSYEGKYDIKDGFPLNPVGRTGIRGRGKLGRWGPNHAADPLVTRWKRNLQGTIINDSLTSRPILQFVAVKRKDNGLWALPGGMVDHGENVSAAAVREFKEEATNSLEMSDDEKACFDHEIEEFFRRGVEVLGSYVDDPRNTDNAWMESRVYNFHDEEGDIVGRITLNAGDDAAMVQWMDADKSTELYASHSYFVSKVAELLNAHW